MTGDIHNISFAIGELKADAIQAKEDRRLMLDSLEHIKKSIAVVPMLADDVNKLKPKIERLEKMEQRGLGVIAGVGLGASGIGVAVSQFISHLWPK